MHRKKLLTLTTTGLLLVPSAAFAGTGDASAVHVDGVLTVSKCHAESGQADCTALSVLGNDVQGSNQQGEGENESSLGGGEDPSGNGGGELWLFRSRSRVDGSGNSSSESSAVTLDVGGQVRVEVLRSRADSNGNAESDGVYLNVAGTEFHVLHAESKGGKGDSAVAVIAGNGVLTNEQTGGVFCPADASPLVVADVICAEGARAGVVDNLDAGGGNVTGGIVTANAGGDPTAPSPGPGDPEAPEGPAPEQPPLARTGLDVLGLLLAGLAGVTSGEGLRRRGRAAA